MTFALKETLASRKQGKDIWYRFWTVIGPCCTDEPAERALFATAQDAMQTQAYLHSLSFFEPVEVEPIGDFNWNATGKAEV